jgi:PAS domain S-box-containing protein
VKYPGQWSQRSVPWFGGLFIGVIVALSAYDIVRSYGGAVEETQRELDTHARVIAEQTARSMQAVDVVLRHVAEQFHKGTLAALSRDDLSAYLRQQAVGLVQIDGLVIVHADGSIRGDSYIDPDQAANINLSGTPLFKALKAQRNLDFVLDQARRSAVDGQWMFPMARRLESSTGEFAGLLAARGRVDYFQRFYRDVQLGAGTTIVLVRRDGTLLARHPPVEAALGQQVPRVAELVAAHAQTRTRSAPLRGISPFDGVERFAAAQLVPDYPLAVFVTRETSVALAPWRAQALGTALRTLALGALTAFLLALLMRQFARINKARASLETSQERYALAAAGSDDGVWDWDFVKGVAFESARAREVQGLPPGPEVQPLGDLIGSLRPHPDDAPRREAAIQAHLAGETPAYECEYRVLHPDGQYRWIRVRALCIRDAAGKPLRMAGSVSDIDARKRAEEALRRSEERYALAVAGSNDGIIDWDVVNDRMYVSERALSILGIEGSHVTVRTRAQWRALVPYHPDDEARAEDDVRKCLDGTTDLRDGEYRIRLPDGSYRWIRHRNKVVRDASGRAIRLAGSVGDIDAHKRAEAALRESEERFALAVAGSDDGIWDWDFEAQRAFGSARAREILGLPPGPEMQSLDEWFAALERQLHPDDKARRAEAIEAHLCCSTPAYEGEFRVRKPDGGYRWVRIRGVCERRGTERPRRISGSVTDIDAQKRTEEALRLSEERYQLAIEGSNEGLWDWDLASDLLFVSPRAQQLIGMPVAEPLAPRRVWIDRLTHHPDDVAHVRQAIKTHLRGKSQHFEIEYRLRHANGEWRWFRQRGVAVRDAGGRAYRMAGSMEDITDRKKAEADRDRLEGQLRQAQKLEAIGTLAGGIAHDFNNILAAILGYGEMAQKDAPEGTAMRRHIDAAISAGMRAKSLVERILAFSRSGMGERVPVHVQSVVEEALELVGASLPQGVRLQTRLAAGDAGILGDPTQIHQVVMNLCANAVQAMKSEGTLTVAVELFESTQPRTVSTNVLPPGRFVRLCVRDTGSGIAPHLLERIFDPFFTTKEVGVGTGLGLSLVHGIVADLGGGIDVESRVDEGSTFTVYLPSQSYVAAPAPVEEEAVCNGAGETVLLVDDEEPLVRLGEEMLAELGYEPVGFASSAAALESFRAAPQRFDAVLSDEAMPGMTGSELVSEIRKIRPDIPIIMMSGYVSPALTARARDAGVVEVLSKPLVSREIARSLASALRA